METITANEAKFLEAVQMYREIDIPYNRMVDLVRGQWSNEVGQIPEETSGPPEPEFTPSLVNGEPCVKLAWGRESKQVNTFRARAFALAATLAAEHAETMAVLTKYFSRAKDQKLGETIRAAVSAELVRARAERLESFARSALPVPNPASGPVSPL